MTTRRVTLLGGTGFVGTQLVYRLAERAEEVVVLTRRAQRARTLRVLPNVHAREADVHDPKALTAALAGSDVVINLVGILNESGGSTFARTHEELAGKVVAACRGAGVPRYLHMSALNADAVNGSSEYLKSKGRAEEAVRVADASLAWTIFRPSVIFGEKDAFFNRFANLLKLMPVFPARRPRIAPRTSVDRRRLPRHDRLDRRPFGHGGDPLAVRSRRLHPAASWSSTPAGSPGTSVP